MPLQVHALTPENYESFVRDEHLPNEAVTSFLNAKGVSKLAAELKSALEGPETKLVAIVAWDD